MSRWRVVAPYQVHHDGVTYASGETFEAREDMVTAEAAAGYLEPVAARESKPARRVQKKTASRSK